MHKPGRSKDTFRLFSESGFRLPKPRLTLSQEDGLPGTYSVRQHHLHSREHDDLSPRVHLTAARSREHTNRLLCLSRRRYYPPDRSPDYRTIIKLTLTCYNKYRTSNPRTSSSTRGCVSTFLRHGHLPPMVPTYEDRPLPWKVDRLVLFCFLYPPILF